jgi:hypothetical protein
MFAGEKAALSGIPNLTTDPHGQNGLNRYESMLAACCTCGFFALDAAKNPRLSGCADLWSERSLQGKKSAESRFFWVLCAKRNKLLEDTKGEKLRYENESFRIRGCIYKGKTALHNL